MLITLCRLLFRHSLSLLFLFNLHLLVVFIILFHVLKHRHLSMIGINSRL